VSALEFCTVEASTKRAQVLGGGVRGALVTHVASVQITPLWPLTQETTQIVGINSPREYKVCYHVPIDDAALPDIREGDRLVVASVEYPVHHVSEWADIENGETSCLELIVQQVKGT